MKHPDPSGQQKLDEMIRVTEGLLEHRVSFDTVAEYLQEEMDTMSEITMRKVLLLAIIEIIQEHRGRD